MPSTSSRSERRISVITADHVPNTIDVFLQYPILPLLWQTSGCDRGRYYNISRKTKLVRHDDAARPIDLAGWK